jgi:hypothetical protein
MSASGITERRRRWVQSTSVSFGHRTSGLHTIDFIGAPVRSRSDLLPGRRAGTSGARSGGGCFHDDLGHHFGVRIDQYDSIGQLHEE